MSAKRDGQAMDETVKAIEAGDRVALARAITLVESAKPEDTVRAQALLERLLPRTGNAIRVGISGVPGAGKSTLIDQLGLNLVSSGKKVAVLAVDPDLDQERRLHPRRQDAHGQARDRDIRVHPPLPRRR